MRRYSASRRRLEFAVICDQVRRRKEAFIARLLRNLHTEGECIVWTGTRSNNGYPRANFRLPVNTGIQGAKRGADGGAIISIEVHRLFVMMATCAPIPYGFEAGHYECHNPLCVRHVKLEAYEDNLEQRDAAQKESKTGCPF